MARRSFRRSAWRRVAGGADPSGRRLARSNRWRGMARRWPSRMPQSFERRLSARLAPSSSAFWRIDVAPLSVARLSGQEGRWNLGGARGPGSAAVTRLMAALVMALAALGASPGEAHRIARPGGPPPEGIAIPSLTHGQMAVIGDNLSGIRALAGARIGFDMTTWRLEDYLSLQSFACLWGLVPGSITDEVEPVQRVRPRLSRRRAGAALATARDAGRRSPRGRGAHPQDRGGDAGQRRFAHALPLQRRAIQHQRDRLSPIGAKSRLTPRPPRSPPSCLLRLREWRGAHGPGGASRRERGQDA